MVRPVRTSLPTLPTSNSNFYYKLLTTVTSKQKNLCTLHYLVSTIKTTLLYPYNIIIIYIISKRSSPNFSRRASHLQQTT